MNSLETYIATRELPSLPIRLALSRIARKLPGPLCNFTIKQIWPKSLRHMRFLTDGSQLEPHKDGTWTLHDKTGRVLRSVPLEQTIGHLDQPVSLIATGPSARDHPWQTFKRGERFVIALNGAPTLLKNHGILPDAMIVTDREFSLTGMQHFENAPGVPLVIEVLAAAALAATSPEFLTGRKITIIERVNSWYGIPALSPVELISLNETSNSPLHFPANSDRKMRVGWSTRPELGFFSGRTVAFAALQLVVGLGAKDIEIIGMDLSGSTRAYREGSNIRPSQLETHYEQYILPSFKIMSEVLALSDVRITNRSKTCPLPAEIFFNASPDTPPVL